MDQQDDDIVSLPEDRKDDRRYPARSRSPVRLYKPPRDSVGQPDFLNESTLIALSTYLLTHRDRLDEDELTNHMVHIDAVTTDRMRYSDFGNDSDEEEGLEDIYRQEEDSVLAQDFFKQAVTIAQEAAPLDKRTINWIRKEMGFVKKKDEILTKSSVAKVKDHNTDESEDSGEQPQMRLTRTQARNTRVKKREERSAKDNQGLKDLFAAVSELELDLGRPFGQADADTKRKIGTIDAETNNTPPNKKKRASKKGMLLQESTDTEEGSGLVALMRKSRTPVKVTKVLVEGTDVNDEFEKDPTTPKRKRRAPTDGSSIKKRRTNYLASPKTPSFRTPQSKPKSSRKIKTPMSEKARPPQKHASDTPISLSLLEWRRRHQWTPSKEQRAAATKLKDRIEDEDDDELQPRMLDDEVPAITIPVTYKDEGIDLRLPPWELCNPVAQIAVGEPPVTEPERLVYTNDKYASWCTKMIDSLTGSARSWARYEFFYSDIDRPWFNFNEFHIELAKHGVSPSAKLTRREWSAVREAIRGRPRRFSRKFISSEMNKLNSYRHLVRMMQHSGLPRPPNFGYEVYPPIKVGHIVTAYNRRFRILQRGSVLTYDINRKMYLIQFERKEVGFEFVLDIDVAAHGVPELIYGASEVALDETLLGGFADRNNQIGSMLYGTLYGRNTIHSVRQQPMVRGLAIRDNDSVVRLYGESMPSSALPENTYLRPFLNANLVEKVAEREIVTKLIEFIDKALKRKMILLEAIDALNQRVTGSYAMDPSGYSRLSPDFQQHYAWLLANLEITTECLDSLMIHLQVMYGRGYAGRGGALYDLPNGRTATEKALATFNKTQPLDPSLCAPWVGALSSASKAAASKLPMSHTKLAHGLSHLEQQRELAMQSRLRAAGQLLMASTYTIALAGNLDHGTDIGTPGAATVALMDQHEQLTKVPLPFYTTDSKTALQAANDRHAVAIKELEEAIESLSSEVAAKHALDCLQSKHRATFAAAS